eukprot:4511930-Amphidinium_carterae.1
MGSPFASVRVVLVNMRKTNPHSPPNGTITTKARDPTPGHSIRTFIQDKTNPGNANPGIPSRPKPTPEQ